MFVLLKAINHVIFIVKLYKNDANDAAKPKITYAYLHFIKLTTCINKSGKLIWSEIKDLYYAEMKL